MKSVSGIHLSLAVLVFGAASVAMADPKTDYLLYCRGCHLANGASVPPEVPTLVNEIGKLVTIPGGREYIIRVPGVTQNAMTDKQLAAVLNWVLQEFNASTVPADFAPYTADEVTAARQKVLADPVRYRASLMQ